MKGDADEPQLFMKEVLWALALLVLLHAIFWALKRRARSSGTEGRFPRGPPAWPVIGHLPLLRVRSHQVLADLCINQGYGPILGLRLGSKRAVVVSSALLAKEVLQTHDKVFANRAPFAFVDNLFYGYNSAIGFSSYNPRLVWMRKVCALELFTAKRLSELCNVRYDELRKLVHQLDQASRGGSHAVDVGMFVANMLANTTARLVHSRTLTDVSHELPELIRAFEFHAFPTLGDFLPFLAFLDVLPKRRMKRLHGRLDKILDSIVKERRQLMANCPVSELPHDFLQVLLSKETNNEEEPMTDHDLKAIMLDLFVGSISTTASTLEWAIAELLQNSKFISKLREEIELVTKDKQGIVIDEAVENMPYLQNVVKEVLRLHPIAPLLVPRISSIECKVGDYTLPKGTCTLVNVWAISRDPLIWEKPNVFNPERFEGKNLDMLGQHYEFLPFGSGRRICLGMRLGITVLQVTLANLVKCFDWELPHGQSASSIDMTENNSLSSSKAIPIVVIPKIRHHIP